MTLSADFGTVKDESGVLAVEAVIESLTGQTITDFFSIDGQQINLKNNNSFANAASPPLVQIANHQKNWPETVYKYSSGLVVGRSNTGDVHIIHPGNIMINSAIDLTNNFYLSSDFIDTKTVRTLDFQTPDLVITSVGRDIVINADLLTSGKITLNAPKGKIIITSDKTITSTSNKIHLMGKQIQNNGLIVTSDMVVLFADSVENAGHITGQYIIAKEINSDHLSGTVITSNFYKPVDGSVIPLNTVSFDSHYNSAIIQFSIVNSDLSFSVTNDLRSDIHITVTPVSSDQKILKILQTNSAASKMLIQNPGFDLNPYIDSIQIETAGAITIENLQASGCTINVIANEITVQQTIDVSNLDYADDADGGNIFLMSAGKINLGSLLANGGGEYVAKKLTDHLTYGGIDGKNRCAGGNITLIALGDITQDTAPLPIRLADWIFIAQQQNNFINYVRDMMMPGSLENFENNATLTANTFFAIDNEEANHITDIHPVKQRIDTQPENIHLALRWVDANEFYYRHAVQNTDLGIQRNLYPKILFSDRRSPLREIAYYGVSFSDALRFPSISANGGGNGFGGFSHTKKLYTTILKSQPGASQDANTIDSQLNKINLDALTATATAASIAVLFFGGPAASAALFLQVLVGSVVGALVSMKSSLLTIGKQGGTGTTQDFLAPTLEFLDVTNASLVGGKGGDFSIGGTVTIIGMGTVTLNTVNAKSGGCGGHGLSTFMDSYSRGVDGGRGEGSPFGIPGLGGKGEDGHIGGGLEDSILCFGGSGGDYCSGGLVKVVAGKKLQVLSMSVNAEASGGDGGNTFAGNGGNAGHGGNGGTGFFFQATGGNGGHGGHGGSLAFAGQFGGVGGDYGCAGVIDLMGATLVSIHRMSASAITSGGYGGSSVAGNGGLAGFAGQTGDDVVTQIIKIVIQFLSSLNRGFNFLLNAIGLSSANPLNAVIDAVSEIDRFIKKYKEDFGLTIAPTSGAYGGNGGSGGVANHGGDGGNGGDAAIAGAIKISAVQTIVIKQLIGAQVIAFGGDGGSSVGGNGGGATKGLQGRAGSGAGNTGGNGGAGGAGGHGGAATHGGIGGAGGDDAIGGQVVLITNNQPVDIKKIAINFLSQGGSGGHSIAGFGANGGAGGNGGKGELMYSPKLLKNAEKKANQTLATAIEKSKALKNVGKSPGIFKRVSTFKTQLSRDLSLVVKEGLGTIGAKIKNVVPKKIVKSKLFEETTKKINVKITKKFGTAEEILAVANKKAATVKNKAILNLEAKGASVTEKAIAEETEKILAKNARNQMIKDLAKGFVITSQITNGGIGTTLSLSFEQTSSPVPQESDKDHASYISEVIHMPQAAKDIDGSAAFFTTNTIGIYAPGGIGGDGGDAGTLYLIPQKRASGGNGGSVLFGSSLLIDAGETFIQEIDCSKSLYGGFGGHLVFGRSGLGGSGGTMGNPISGSKDMFIELLKTVAALPTAAAATSVAAYYVKILIRTVKVGLFKIIQMLNSKLRVSYRDSLLDINRELETIKGSILGILGTIENAVKNLLESIPLPLRVIFLAILASTLPLVLVALQVVKVALGIIFNIVEGIVQSALIGLAGSPGGNQLIVPTASSNHAALIKSGRKGAPGYFTGFSSLILYGALGGATNYSFSCSAQPTDGLALQPIAYSNLILSSPVRFRSNIRIGSSFNHMAHDLVVEPIVNIVLTLDSFTDKSINEHVLDTEHRVQCGALADDDTSALLDIINSGGSPLLTGITVVASVLSPLNLAIAKLEVGLGSVIEAITSGQKDRESQNYEKKEHRFPEYE